MTKAVCVLVDWGTSNLRLWAVTAEGEATDMRRSDQGMSKLAPDMFAPTLQNLLSDMQIDENAPILMCGMVGAASGWQEARYLDAPTKIDKLAEAVIHIEHEKRDIRIIPGVAQRLAEAPDVMRGEETLLLGLAQNTGQILLPGTHSKWVRMQDGNLTEFRTVMTGEIFALLKNHSIVRHTLSPSQWQQDVFLDAVQAGFSAPEAMLNQIFSLRAGPLLFGSDVSPDGTSRLSGWLIGAEIATSYQTDAGPLTLVSDGDLGTHYVDALSALDIAFSQANATQAAQAGLLACAQKIWPDIFRLNISD